MRLEFSPYVEQDLDAIADFIAEDSPVRAVAFVREAWRKILKVGEQPFLYRVRPEIGEGARLAIVGHYVILFRVVDDMVRIERIVYGGRDLSVLLEQPPSS